MGGGQNRVAPGRAQEVKQGVASEASCKTVVALGGESIDLLLGNVLAPSTGESHMPYEVLNEDKTNVGERPFFEETRGPGACPRKNSWMPRPLVVRKSPF